MSVSTRTDSTQRLRTGLGITLCVVIDSVVAYAIFSGPYGTAILMDDELATVDLVVPVVVGAVVGMLQYLSFDFAVTVSASLLGVFFVGGTSVVLLATLVLAAAGGAVGCLAAEIMRRHSSPSRRTSRALLGAVVVAAVICLVVIASGTGLFSPFPVLTDPS